MTSEVNRLNHRTGRPKKLVKRDLKTSVYFTKLEYYAVKQKAAKAGVGISFFLRELALKCKILPVMTEEERQLVRQLTAMANHFDHLATIAREEGLIRAIMEFEKYKNSIDELFEKLKEC